MKLRSNDKDDSRELLFFCLINSRLEVNRNHDDRRHHPSLTMGYIKEPRLLRLYINPKSKHEFTSSKTRVYIEEL